MAFEADETLAAQALVAAGVGVTLLPRMALTAVHPGTVPEPSRMRRSAGSSPRAWRAASTRPQATRCSQIFQDVAEEFSGPRLELAAS